MNRAERICGMLSCGPKYALWESQKEKGEGKVQREYLKKEQLRNLPNLIKDMNLNTKGI